MRNLIFIVAFAAFGFVASEASAVTVINVTQDEVKKQCNGQDKCMTVCGSTYCDTSATNRQVNARSLSFSKSHADGSYCRAFPPHERASSRRLCAGTLSPDTVSPAAIEAGEAAIMLVRYRLRDCYGVSTHLARQCCN